MSTYEELRAATSALFPPVLAAAGTGETAHRLAEAEQRLTHGELTAVICGEFKRGKSTLLNALLHEQSGLLPVDTIYATRLVTAVYFGEPEEITVILDGDGDAGAPERRVITRPEIADYVTESGNPRNLKRAVALEIRTPNPRLRSGVRWVDTPGVGGVHEDHTKVTAGFLPNADALIFVADVTKPLTESEMVFLRGAATAAKVTEDADGLLFVLTKIDAVGDYQPFVDSFTTKAADVVGRKPGELTVVPVSAQAHLDYLADGADADRELGNFAALETALWDTLNRRRATVLLGGALTALDDAAMALLAPIDAAVEAARQQTDEDLAALRTQIEAQQRRVADLPRDTARWRAELTKQVTALGGTLKRRGGAGLDEVWHRVNTEYLYQQRFLDNPEQLLGQISSDVAVVFGAVNELADREAARILAEIAASSELKLRPPSFPSLPHPPVPSVVVTGALGKADRPEHAMRRVRDTLFGAGTGGAVAGGAGAGIGAIIGTFIFPGLGTAAGAHFGGWLGSALGVGLGARYSWRNATDEFKKQDREARRKSIRTEIASLHREQARHLDEAQATLRAGLLESITAELESRIAQERESIDAAVRRLQRDRAGTAEEAEQRLAALHAERAPLEQTRVEVARLAERVAALRSPATAS